MPPTAKFSKDEIIDAALSIIRIGGSETLTARSLASKLGSSARPIFTVFSNMDEVHQAAIEAAKLLYKQYIDRGLSEKQSFKGVGTAYILFSINEPKLFQLLFMTEKKQIPNLTCVLPLIDDNYEKILQSVQKDYVIDRVSAEILYRHLWIYTHGIATLCATRMCSFTPEEINEMLTQVCVSLLKTMKAGIRHD